MKDQQPQQKPQTIVITNFGGRLSRKLNGDMNSGFAKFTTSFGYDPFSKPGNLTWLEQPTSVAGVSSLVQAGKVLSASNSGPNVHLIDQGGNWYQIRSSSQSNANLNSIIGISSVSTQGYFYGTSMEFFGSVVGQDLAGNNLGKLYVGGDNGIKSINPNGSAETTVGTAGSYVINVYHPLKQFAGKLIFGNGNTIAAIDSTGTVTSSVIGTGIQGPIYSALNPALGTNTKVLDLEVSTSNDYVTIATAELLQEERLDSTGYDIVETFGSQSGKLVLWNGVDIAATAATSVPTYLVSALETFFNKTAFFAADAFGTAFNDGSGKLLTLPNSKPPLPNAVCTNGNFMTWASPETDSTSRYLSFYYYGGLDQENPPGLYRLLKWTTPQSNGFVSKVALNLLVSNKYTTVNTSQNALVVYGYGKHYISVNSVNATTTQGFLLSFLVTPSGTGTPQQGVYETQTQLFSKRIGTSQIRVYTEPTIAGNAFQLDMIGVDGAVIPSGSYTYAYGDITDPQSGATSVQRINFPANIKSQYALGIRITNTGTTNMTIKKVEIDLNEEGK